MFKKITQPTGPTSRDSPPNSTLSRFYIIIIYI